MANVSGAAAALGGAIGGRSPGLGLGLTPKRSLLLEYSKRPGTLEEVILLASVNEPLDTVLMGLWVKD